ncbi:MAG: hypothetical protein ABWX93_05280, partial [Pseudoxanthomonas sp.]
MAGHTVRPFGEQRFFATALHMAEAAGDGHLADHHVGQAVTRLDQFNPGQPGQLGMEAFHWVAAVAAPVEARLPSIHGLITYS